MSKSRARRKQRRRARQGSGAPEATAQERAAGRAQERAAGRAQERAAGRAQERGTRRAQARAEPAPAPPSEAPAKSATATRQASQRRPSRLDVRAGVPRPDAVWAPFPLTEIGMAVGLALFALGFVAGTAGLFLAGIGVLVVVVAELCLREHFSGFRSHSLLLGLLPVTAIHLGVVYAGAATWRGPLALAIDLTVAAALAWWLRRRFAAAQAGARAGAR
ncbi:MAG: hypothetical protein ACLGI5_16230 [Thermoleophilia bacterium]